jgi:hypothetical protein
MDEYTNFMWAIFLKTKDEQFQVIIRRLIHMTNEKNDKVKYIRCDNSEEKYDLNIQIFDNYPKCVCQFEFTGLDSSQQNGKTEKKACYLVW